MKARVIQASMLSGEDRSHWRALQASNSRFSNPFFTPDFSEAMGAARADAQVAVLDQGGARAYFPYHRRSGGVAKPIGGPLCDYQGVIHGADFHFEAEELLAACGLASYDFNHALAEEASFHAGAVSSSASPFMDLSSGFEEYAKTLPQAGRHAVKETERRRRKLEREVGPVRFVYKDRDEEAWRWLVETKSRAFRRMGVKPAFELPWIAALLARLRNADSADFSGILSTVRAGDTIVAAHFGMRSARVLHWWFTTYDEAHRAYAPGLILILEVARLAASEGWSILDFGRGDQYYKTAFANGETPLCEGSIERARTPAGWARRLNKAAIKTLAPIPLGRFQSLPRRILTRVLTGSVRLPDKA